MSTPATAYDFLTLTRSSGLLDEDRFADKFPDPSALPADPRSCAAALVEAGLLTQFQANQLLAGKYRGMVLGSYKILRPVGTGGSVFLAEHSGLRRKSALKVLPAEAARDPKALERFYREARAAAALDHPNIARLHDVNQGAGVHFLVMEYVEGRDLQSVLDESGPIHYARAVHFAAQVAAGLRHAHDRGFVHRDIRPANLLLAKGGLVKILDMGLARSFQESSDGLTRTLGTTPGSADYVSPEQAMNERVDERSDVYSLGATLFALITGRPPFTGAPAEVLLQHQTAVPPRLSDRLKVSVPPELNAAIAKMMAKQKGDRYPSAAAVIDALAPWIPAGAVLPDPAGTADLRASAPTARTRPRVARATPTEPQRKTRLLIGAAVGAVAVVVILVALFGFSGTGPQPVAAAASGPSVAAPPPAVVAPPVSGERFVSLPFKRVANMTTAQHLCGNPDPKVRLVFPDWQPKRFNGVPFQLIDPKGGAVKNAFALYSANRPEETGRYPRSVKLPVNSPVAAIHVLGGVAGWGWPYRATSDKNLPGSPEGADVVHVRIRYKDGQTERHVWRNGEHFTDYNKVYEATGSMLAFELEQGRYLRYLVLKPNRDAEVREVEFAKAPTDEYTCPIFMAVTAERP